MIDPSQLIHSLGYVGLFIAVLVTSASMFVGIPTFTYVMLAVSLGMDPFLSSLIAGVAGSIGELPAYFLGWGSKKLLERKYKEAMETWNELFKRYGFFAIAAVAALPFPPDEVSGLLAGSARYPIPKFLLATALGKTLKYLLMAFLTLWGIDLFF